VTYSRKNYRTWGSSAPLVRGVLSKPPPATRWWGFFFGQSGIDVNPYYQRTYDNLAAPAKP